MTIAALRSPVRGLVPAALIVALASTAPAGIGAEGEPQAGASIPPVPVFVTDKKGRAVTDLTADDFTLHIDGTEVALSDVDRVHGGDPPRRLVVYFDLLHLRIQSRNALVKKLESFLPDESETGVETLLASSDGSVTIHTNFTTDRGKLRDALDAVMRRDVRFSPQSERRAVECLTGESADASACPKVIQQYTAELYERTVAALPPIESFVLDLGNVPGVKAFLYVGDGLPLVPAEEVFEVQNGGAFGPTDSDRDLTEKFDVIAEAAATNGVVFYSYRTGAFSGGLISASQTFTPSPAISTFFSNRERNFQSGPMRLCRRTGGSYADSPNSMVRWLESDLATYYALDFVADVPADGRYHAIKVDVDRKKVVVRYPDGYHDLRVSDPRL